LTLPLGSHTVAATADWYPAVGVNSLDAALILQLDAGLIGSLG
jgi:hypothetical protein